MDIKGKINVENQKKSALKKLDAQRAFLKEKGVKDDQITKNVIVRKLKAEVRKADFRLACIADQEKQDQDLARAKAEKLASGKKAKAESKKEAKLEGQGKKEEKEKSEKKTKPEGKKDKK
jgi:hypothetical protein